MKPAISEGWQGPFWFVAAAQLEGPPPFVPQKQNDGPLEFAEQSAPWVPTTQLRVFMQRPDAPAAATPPSSAPKLPVRSPHSRVWTWVVSRQLPPTRQV